MNILQNETLKKNPHPTTKNKNKNVISLKIQKCCHKILSKLKFSLMGNDHSVSQTFLHLYSFTNPDTI